MINNAKRNRNWLANGMLAAVVMAGVCLAGVKPKPVLYIIGDSTVKNGDGKGGNGQWGWGTLLPAFFDTGRLQIQNHAIGGRSSRTFITEGRWERILSTLKKGDYVLMQFGHNDAGPLDDTARARGTIRGIGPETQEIYNPIQKRQEVVHTYGWYMRKYVREAKEKGAIPIICSPVPRNNWQNGKIRRATADYGSWASQVAQQTNAYFIDLNESIAREYEKMDTASVSKLFYGDHTHTSLAGAQLNAQQVAKGIAGFKKLKLRKYLLK